MKSPRSFIPKMSAALLLTAGIAAQASAAFSPWTGSFLDLASNPLDDVGFQVRTLTADSILPHKVTLVDAGSIAPFDFLYLGVVETGNGKALELFGPSTGFFSPASIGKEYTLTVVGDPGAVTATFSFSTFGVTVTPIPEPGTYAMLLAGLGLVGWMAKRRLSDS